MRTTVGGLVERLVDNIANRVPVIRVVYNVLEDGRRDGLR